MTRPFAVRLGAWLLIPMVAAVVFFAGRAEQSGQPSTAGGLSALSASPSPSTFPMAGGTAPVGTESTSPQPIPTAPTESSSPPAVDPSLAATFRTSAPPPAPASQAPSGPVYRIEIPRLAINLPVAEGDVRRDVDKAQTPEYYAFHLPGTSMFGNGNTYLYAHARIGMFLSLWNARVGDLVIVRTPNGPREYLVAEVHPRVPPTEISWAGPTNDTRLTLQTSTGPNGDDPRFVVVARPRGV